MLPCTLGHCSLPPLQWPPYSSPAEISSILQIRLIHLEPSDYFTLLFTHFYCINCLCMQLSHVRLFATPWTVAHQAPLSIGSSRQEQRSGLPSPSPGALPKPGIKPVSLASPALAGELFTTGVTWEALIMLLLLPSHFSRVQLCQTP